MHMHVPSISALPCQPLLTSDDAPPAFRGSICNICSTVCVCAPTCGLALHARTCSKASACSRCFSFEHDILAASSTAPHFALASAASRLRCAGPRSHLHDFSTSRLDNLNTDILRSCARYCSCDSTHQICIHIWTTHGSKVRSARLLQTNSRELTARLLTALLGYIVI